MSVTLTLDAAALGLATDAGGSCPAATEPMRLSSTPTAHLPLHAGCECKGTDNRPLCQATHNNGQQQNTDAEA